MTTVPAPQPVDDVKVTEEVDKLVTVTPVDRSEE
jgi:hypothetical protein